MTDNGTHLRRPEHEAHAELVRVLDGRARDREIVRAVLARRYRGAVEPTTEMVETVLAGLRGERGGVDADALAALVEADARAYPHDEPCPACGRRQWGLGPGTVDPQNPSDAEQETCGACGYQWQEGD